MTPRDLTGEEWHHIRTLRGQKMTGYYAHRAKCVPINKDNPSIVRGVGDTYFWPMGKQPDEAMIKKIGRKCPIKAANAFLKMFKPVDVKKCGATYTTPVPIK